MADWETSSRLSSPFIGSDGGSTPQAGPRRTPGRFSEEMERLVFGLHRLLIEELESEKIAAVAPEERRKMVEQAAQAVIRREMPSVSGITRDQIVGRVVDEVVGLGPIEALAHDNSVSEVMVNGPDEVYIEREGIIYLSDVRFRDDDHIMRIVERIIAPIGRRVDEASPMVDARLPDGSRVNVIIPPLAPKSPTITIRKFRKDKMTMADLVKAGTLPEELIEFLGICVHQRLNILVSGGTGSGKTTLLNALSAYIPDSERIVTIEDPIELKLQQSHVVSLEARPPNIDGKGEVTARDLLRNTLRMRPDRILIGEVRGPEAFDMLNAMNTGHEGSLSTVHANSPRDALSRVENMVLMANLELPERAIREQVSSALHLIIQLARFRDGVRRITHITEVTGMEGLVITMQDLFRFEQTGVDAEGRILGHLKATGIRPAFADQFEVAGVSLSPTFFLNSARW
ncbi:MAG TPA: CpaF family protein [Dehalococcoidia bacterium]|nr:CpaF family protein [Dehalococcoidia bacterium]